MAALDHISHSGKLDLTIVIPTRNSMPRLVRHLEELDPLIRRAREVIAVDSDSTDGTRECLRHYLSHSHCRVMQHPPGLYESWNSAIAQAQGRYLYIATVGDGFSDDSILELYRSAEEFSADIVISPPAFEDECGNVIGRIWPIHRLLWGNRCGAEPVCLNPIDVLYFNALFPPGTLIGSSASNLYKTSLLQADPFPLDFGINSDFTWASQHSDSIWAIQHSTSARWVIVPQVRSRFIRHSSSHGSIVLPDGWLQCHADLIVEAAKPLGLSSFEGKYRSFLQVFAEGGEVENQIFTRYDSRRCLKKARIGYWKLLRKHTKIQALLVEIRQSMLSAGLGRTESPGFPDATFIGEWNLRPTINMMSNDEI